MHFSKTYAHLLSTLPPELRDNPFEYRKLKQLINQTVFELDALGLGPAVLQGLACLQKHDETLTLTADAASLSDASYTHPTIAYEIVLNAAVPEPRLRLSSRYPCDAGAPHDAAPATDSQPVYHVELLVTDQLLGRITTTLLHPPILFNDEVPSLQLQDGMHADHFGDLIIPLPSDAAFFQLLTSTLSSLSGHFDTLLDSFTSALSTLAATISSTARPASSSAPHSFIAYSVTANNVMSLIPPECGKSDLYAWREIFRLYAEVQVFETVRESTQGERSIDDVERQLKLFEDLIKDQKASLVLPTSKDALDVFLSLNVFILDVKKLQFANSEATRKILKKHAKRTTLPIPFYPLAQDASISAPLSRQLASITSPPKPLPRLLVQALGEALLPVIPHIDDYACLICTYVAFKPIRLGCGHFFCVRCLAKLQRRGKGNCPLCRAPTVLHAGPSHLDYGLLNFIADWFPVESREKRRADAVELTQEQMEAFGIADVRGCRIM